MSDIRIRRLRPDDDRDRFVSGDPDLDRFFHRFAGQNQFRHHIGASYVAEAAGHLLGFVTLSAFEPMETIEGALHERPEPRAMFLPLSAIPMADGD